MDRGATEHIRESRRKERQKKKVRKTLTLLTVVEKLAKRELTKQ